MIKMTKIELVLRLELMLDIDMYLFIGKGMREDISYIAKRFSKPNNKYMLILNILMLHIDCIMILHYLQKNLKLLILWCQIIAVILQMNME